MVALRSTPPPALAAPPRAKSLALDVAHIRSVTKRDERCESRVLLQEAMRIERALVLDLADALDVDERLAARVIRGRHPFDLGDLLALARSGRGGARLARRILAMLGDAVSKLELSHR